ncbi:MAG: serine/threonine protein kinase [Polyangiaceae bacterium]|nr:serine/threonine protein kinase [Polyangiaceae bacterium]
MNSGEVLDGQYRVLRLIGEGGQGAVYEAEDLDIGAPVAIKILKREVADSPEFTTRMRREARAMGVLSGTAAVQVFALNRTKEGQMYIVMEMLRGHDLERHLHKHEREFGPLPVPTMIELLAPIVDTLEAAHARGIVHRDLKPANIFVLDSTARGRVRLLDFGMIKDLSASTPLTQDGYVVGSPSFIAPESWQGSSITISSAADMYAMGAVIYRILAGHVPFRGESLVDVVRLVIRGPRPTLTDKRPDLPKGIDRWVARVLAVEPQHRFASIREMWSTLMDLLKGWSGDFQRNSIPPRGSVPPGRGQ